MEKQGLKAYKYSCQAFSADARERERLPAADAKKRILQELRELKSCECQHPYARQKMRAVEDALEAIEREGSPVDFGYDLGLRPPYGGLPLKFFSQIDSPIIELVDKLAREERIAILGECCSGHLSVPDSRNRMDMDIWRPFFSMAFHPDDCQIRTDLYLLLGEVRASSSDRRITLTNQNGVILGGLLDREGLQFLTLKVMPDITPASRITGSERDVGGSIGMLIQYWKEVASRLSSVFGNVVLQHGIKPSFFTRSVFHPEERRYSKEPESD